MQYSDARPSDEPVNSYEALGFWVSLLSIFAAIGGTVLYIGGFFVPEMALYRGWEVGGTTIALLVIVYGLRFGHLEEVGQLITWPFIAVRTVLWGILVVATIVVLLLAEVVKWIFRPHHFCPECRWPLTRESSKSVTGIWFECWSGHSFIEEGGQLKPVRFSPEMRMDFS